VTDDRPYRDDDEHLADELRRLDLILAARTLGFRRELAAATTGGALYVSHDEVDRLLSGDARADEPSGPARSGEVQRARINRRVRRSADAGIDLALPRLAALFSLTDLECDVVLICLGPELDPKYDRIYAYLQDDITRRRPSLALVLDLLHPPPSRRALRRALSPHGALRRFELVHLVEDTASPSGHSALSCLLRLDERILGTLLGDESLDPRLRGLATPQPPPAELPAHRPVDAGDDVDGALARLLAPVEGETQREPLIVHLSGPPGVGRRDTAARACARWGRHFLVVDLARLLARSPEPDRLLRVAAREARLRGAILYLDHADALFSGDATAAAQRRAVAQVLGEYAEPVVLAGTIAQAWPAEFRAVRFHHIRLGMRGASDREVAWKEALSLRDAPAVAVDELARFRLTPGQIRQTVAAARLSACSRGEDGRVTAEDLLDAARRQSRHRLGDLAFHVAPRAGWPDLVLPEEQKAQLRDIGHQVRHRELVLDRWGYGRGRGTRGVSALFVGPPGTGKTLAAEVIAGDLHLDLYTVDLSTVVSKYLGETEKNLARVFEEAEAGHCVLFFDEADALFGKRTKVRDAHDRYANIETSYLLRRLEQFDGIVVLATNLRENMDDAFTRRLGTVVDFPFPDEARRREIWARHLPDRAPVAADVDVDLLAREVSVAGGHIRTIVVNAAFLAAADTSTLRMRHLLDAARREFSKLGKPWPELLTTTTPGRSGHG
jgi:SpoVK/Ycf46/Vps4 family AAA+-type ATPase